ncbi:adenosylcobinamide amidohydrolase [Nocardioides piscis]|uniref:Adenosylcobinamide amidohydrolase n=1 Tax=Nocardioides piscis TaxID=2714938 RepID=A0A6G7YIF3_9ACTN|nr:adenosylcobinamide amidohydrolase [Nocardioides piscis]QIK76451.1 adenosylcobinamide amidohydrolase [Nocardioides piscis]
MTYGASILPPGPDHRHVLVWQFDRPVHALSSASVGGGFSTPAWLLNVGVPHDYSRIDLDEHAAAIATGRDLSGSGIAMFTAVDVTRAEHACFEGASVCATVGVTKPTWAADPEAGHALWPGTINLVAQLPVALEQPAMVQALLAMTEAKTQALLETQVPGTGTASDAITLVCPVADRAERFGGVRSTWGHRLAMATHAAVHQGLAAHPGRAR